MTKKIEKIESTDEAWESRKLGADEEFVESVTLDDLIIEEAVGLQAISIRLPKNLLEDLKLIASLNGLGYQPLMKQVLKRFVDGEKKRILRKEVTRQRKELEDEKMLSEVQATENKNNAA